MSAYEYKLGPDSSSLVLLSDYNIPAPHSGYQPYSVLVKLGDATLKGQGFPVVTWHWAFVTTAQRDTFISFLDAGALSGSVGIRSRKPDNSWADFDCIMNLPTGEEDLQAGRVLNFDVTFTHCVEIP